MQASFSKWLSVSLSPIYLVWVADQTADPYAIRSPRTQELSQVRRNEVVSRGRRNSGLQFIRRSLKSQRLSWPLIETQSDLI